MAGDPVDFQRYVQGSDAEFSVAQGIYVETQSGWISDRTIRYLASGRPALVQDTGQVLSHAHHAGFLTFADLDGAVEAAAPSAASIRRMRRAARLIAEQHFDSDKVLSDFLKQCGVVQEAVMA